MKRTAALLAGLLLTAPAAAFAAVVQAPVRAPASRTPVAVGVERAASQAGQSLAFSPMPLFSVMGAAFNGQYRPTLSGIADAVRAYTLKLRANVVQTFYVGAVDTATYMPSGEVAAALKALQMPVHEQAAPESIRFIERRGSALRPASVDDPAAPDAESAYLAEGGAASSAKGQLGLIHHRGKALSDQVDPSGIGRRIEGSVSFDGGRHSGLSLN